MRFTRFRTGALFPCTLLFILGVGLLLKGDTCGAVGVAGIIGLVGQTFADRPDSELRKGGPGKLETR